MQDTREARFYIMDEVYVQGNRRAETRQLESMHLRSMHDALLIRLQIGDVVGKQGKVINRIIAETGVKIDITDDGNVSICGTDADMIAKAMKTDRDHHQLISKRDRFLRVLLSVSRTSAHSLSSHQAKRVWFISPRCLISV